MDDMNSQRDGWDGELLGEGDPMMAFSKMQQLTVLIDCRADMVISARGAALQIIGGWYLPVSANDAH